MGLLHGLINRYRFSLHADGQLFIRQRIRDLVRAFTERAQRIRRRLELPPTPSSVSSDPGETVRRLCPEMGLLALLQQILFPYTLHTITCMYFQLANV